MTLNEAYQKISTEVLEKPSLKKDINFAILALHESATKLWQGVENGEKEKTNSRAASALIAVFHVMKELEIENVEECLLQKVEELKISEIVST